MFWLDSLEQEAKRKKRVALYRGENAILENGIEYRNVEDYLKSFSYSGEV